jgi:hypothetical protein
VIILRLDETTTQVEAAAIEDEAGYCGALTFDGNIYLVLDRDGLRSIAKLAGELADQLKGDRYALVPK